MTYFATIYNNSNAQTEFKSFIEKLDKATGATTSVVRLLGGLNQVSHMEMQKGLLTLYRIALRSGFENSIWIRAEKEFLAAYGFHSDAELDITVPRWSEVPGRVRELIEGILASGVSPADPIETINRQKKSFDHELNKIEKIFKRNYLLRLQFRSKFYKNLNRARAYLIGREKMREYSTRCYALMRYSVLEAERRWLKSNQLENKGDIFLLHSEELVNYSTGKIKKSEVNCLIERRRKIYLGYRNFLPPNELGRGVTQRSLESYQDSSLHPQGQKNQIILKGVGCSSGIHEGTVRVLESLSQMDQIVKGDILVTRFTDPSWTPVLGLVSGIVTEVGGLLSHAAVIGREYGIPAVLNLPGATRTLKTGERIRINGSTGIVEVLL